MSKQHPSGSFVKSKPAANINDGNWKDRLILRRYRFPASGETENDLATRIEQGGVGYFFPLGTSNVEAATATAARIYQTVLDQGWNSVFQQFPRELIVSFEWCMNPVLWTYTTIHTLVGKRAEPALESPPVNPNRQRVLILELDAGIRRALCWSIDQQSGFGSVGCDSVEAFTQALATHKPRMVLLTQPERKDIETLVAREDSIVGRQITERFLHHLRPRIDKYAVHGRNGIEELLLALCCDEKPE